MSGRAVEAGTRFVRGMARFVSPIQEPNDPTKIKEMIVAADLPIEQPRQCAAETGILSVMQRSQIREVVRPGDAARDMHGQAAWAQVLKARREAEGNPNWQPGWSEGVRFQNEVYKILRAEFQ